ncbi:protein CHUP1, chloroplastic-like isoform X2 [Asparagus officinalis]|uniref:protein CHUP1, chloroplastic-like isoform X2 n=1 Tax=Asparagus officinalis TaxID=4686 RepID=UPI00098E2AF5|nr:protein CHUP1, chloroplastic-like isoform X2 [Asparagus officinalis]
MEKGLLVKGGKRDTRPLLLKLGFALALSLGGYFASRFRSKPRLPPPKPKSSSGSSGSEESTAKSSAMAASGLKDELHILTSENPDRNTVEPMEKYSELEERLEMEKEIAYLRNLVEALKERERNLEIQLIEYYGLKEQEASLRELENRLKVNAMESKLLNLKIESLQADNQKLQAQASEYPKVVSELESARNEIKLLKKRLKFDGEQAREKLAALHQRITEMLDRERKHGEHDIEVEKKLKRLKELEDEVVTLRNVNSSLVEENLKFAQLLESTKIEASSNSHRNEERALEEAGHLREENEELKKELEQLQIDRCADVEELVYLRWVNACLRYELRNYQPPQGKTVARDLSKCLSPESEKKAKQLILEYGSSEKNISLFDFDTESCSSSQTSSEECSDASIASTKNSRSGKSKLVSKLKKLVLGTDNNRNKVNSIDGNSMRRASVSPCSFEDTNTRRNSFESVSSSTTVENALRIEQNPNAQPPRYPRSSLDVQRTRNIELEVDENLAQRCRSDLGTSRGHMRMISEDCLSDFSHNLDHEHGNAPEKVKLKKFADVLKGSKPFKSKRRLASFS